MYEIAIELDVLKECDEIDIYTKFQDQFVLYKKKGTSLDVHSFMQRAVKGNLRLFIDNVDKEKYISSKQLQFHNQLKKTVSIDIPKAREALHSLISTVLESPRNGVLARMKAVINELVEEYLSNPEVVIQLTQISLHDYSTQLHLSNVMLYSIGYMCHVGNSKDKTSEFGLAGLLHDVGKLEIPDYLLQAPRKLTQEEFSTVQNHTTKGASSLIDLELPDVVIDVALNHHERLDGSGYPSGIRSSEVSEFSKTLAIIDCFEALTSWRPYKTAVPPLDALNIIKDDVQKGKLDAKIFADFAKSIIGIKHAIRT